jgi:uncharacterized protein YdhG (YjbR/CyaY superfamily)
MDATREQPGNVDEYIASFEPSVHAVFCPPIKGDSELENAASVYAGEKGNLRFPYDQPIPYELIGALTRLRAEQDSAKASGKRRTGPAR